MISRDIMHISHVSTLRKTTEGKIYRTEEREDMTGPINPWHQVVPSIGSAQLTQSVNKHRRPSQFFPPAERR